MCLKCYGIVTSRIVHLCGKVQTVKNLVDSAYGLISPSAESVVSSILKTKMKQENIFRGEKFMIELFTSKNNCLTIVAETQDKKSDHAGLNQVSFGTILELFKRLELSQHQTKKICSVFIKNLLVKKKNSWKLAK